MSVEFDPYHEWLQVRGDERPPNHYSLLGLRLFEEDEEKIDAAYRERYGLVRKYQVGERSAFALQLVTELSKAHDCLTAEKSKAQYDEELRASGVDAVEDETEKEEAEALPTLTPKTTVPSGAPSQSAAGPPQPIQRVDAVWYLKTSEGLRFGPMTREELDHQVRQGSVTADCQVMREGWPQPKWAHEVYTQLTAVAVTPSQAAPVSLSAFETKPKKSLAPVIGIAAGAVVLIGIIIGVVIAMGKKDDPTEIVSEKKPKSRSRVIRSTGPRDGQRDGKKSTTKTVTTQAPTLTGSADDWQVQSKFYRNKAHALSRSGRWLALAGMDGRIRVWNTADRSFVQTLTNEEEEPVTQLAFTGDEQTLFAARGVNVERWDWVAAKLQETIEPPRVMQGDERVVTLCVSPDASRLMVGYRREAHYLDLTKSNKDLGGPQYSNDLMGQAVHHPRQQEIFAATTQGASRGFLSGGRFKTELMDVPRPVTSVQVDRTGGRLLAAGQGQLVLWHVARRRVVQTFKVDRIPQYTLAFSADGRRAFVGAADGKIRRFDLTTGGELYAINIGMQVYHLSVHPDGKTMVCTSPVDVQLLNRGPGSQQLVRNKNINTPETAFASHFPDRGAPKVAVETKKSSTLPETTKKKDDPPKPTTPHWHLMTKLENPGTVGTYCVEFHPQRAKTLYSGHDRALLEWNLDSKKAKPLVPGAQRVRSIAIDATASHLAFSNAATVRLLDLTTGDTKSVPSARSTTSLEFGPSGEYLIGKESGNTIRVWDITKDVAAAKFQGHPTVAHRVVAHPKSNHLVVVGVDNRLRVFELGGKSAGTIVADDDVKMFDIDFNHDATLVAAAGLDKLLIWKQDGSLARSIPRPTASSRFQAIACHPNRNTMAAVINGDRRVRVWNMDDGKLIAELAGPAGPVTSVAFSPDGTLLAAGSHGAAITVWKFGLPTASMSRRPSAATVAAADAKTSRDRK